jgi:PAS domain S-box-containing protein
VNRILVIDDNADNRYSMRLLLDGYEVIEADNGADGIDLALTSHPDCILLDVQMPGMDGFEVCRRLRAMEETRTLPIIFVTAHHRDTESVVRGLAAGGDDYVTKPVAQQELLARVRAMLRIHDLQHRLESLNRNLEGQVRRRTEELRQVYATVPVGIYTLDATGRFTSFNAHLQDLLGYEEDEVVGKMSIGDLFRDQYDMLYWLDLCRREGQCAVEGQARTKDERFIPVFDERVATVDEVGEHVGFTGYMMDMRQRNRMRELVKEQETQAAVGRLAAGIVHEIANPISGVGQYLDAMIKRLERSEKIEPAELRRGAAVMRDALTRTTDLIRRLRGFTRSAIRPGTTVEVCALIDDLHTLMRHNLHQQGIAVHSTCEEGTSTAVAGDPGRLSQVFMNLMANARDAMPDGGTLTVEVRADDSTVEVVFRDTGVGIPKDRLDRIFDFLYTTKGEEGTGFGLTISRDIVEEHGGRIEVESDVGQGAAFRVVLPKASSGATVAGGTAS